jgi:hypothetical protein
MQALEFTMQFVTGAVVDKIAKAIKERGDVIVDFKNAAILDEPLAHLVVDHSWECLCA